MGVGTAQMCSSPEVWYAGQGVPKDHRTAIYNAYARDGLSLIASLYFVSVRRSQL